jgi:hypothetical protein
MSDPTAKSSVLVADGGNPMSERRPSFGLRGWLAVAGAFTGGAVIVLIVSAIAAPPWREYADRAKQLELTKEVQTRIRETGTENLKEMERIYLKLQAGPKTPVWNTWFEQEHAGVAFTPLTSSPAGASVNLVLDLVTIPLMTGTNGVSSFRGISTFQQWLRSVKTSTADIRVLVVPAEKYFVAPTREQRTRTVSISIEKLKSALTVEENLGPEAAMAYLREHRGTAAWDVVHEQFTLHLRPHEGMASAPPVLGNVAVILWVDDPQSGVAPVGNLSASLCISPSGEMCKDSTSVNSTLSGPKQQITSAVQFIEAHDLSDAALHFVELDENTLVGVFRCNTCPDWRADEYLTWPINSSAADLVRQLHDTILDGLENADAYDNDAEYLRAGQALYNLLFGSSPEAQRRFGEFIEYALKSQGESHTHPLRLFVRVLSVLPRDAFAVPMGLMAVKTPAGRDVIAGDAVEIQQPLPDEDYTTSSSCLSTWAALIPGREIQDPDMVNARSQVTSWFGDHEKLPGVHVFNRIEDFADWLVPGAPEEEVSSAAPSVLMVLSHHEPGRLFFDMIHRTPAVYAASMLRRFPTPSVAIVDACGTGKPGALDIIEKLNGNRVTTVIATSTSVNAYLGGAYLDLLIRRLKDAHGNYSIGDANFEAVHDLSKRLRGDPGAADRPFGAAAYAFQVLGNSAVQVCMPQAGEQGTGQSAPQ